MQPLQVDGSEQPTSTLPFFKRPCADSTALAERRRRPLPLLGIGQRAVAGVKVEGSSGEEGGRAACFAVLSSYNCSLSVQALWLST